MSGFFSKQHEYLKNTFLKLKAAEVSKDVTSRFSNSALLANSMGVGDCQPGVFEGNLFNNIQVGSIPVLTSIRNSVFQYQGWGSQHDQQNQVNPQGLWELNQTKQLGLMKPIEESVKYEHFPNSIWSEQMNHPNVSFHGTLVMNSQVMIFQQE